MKFFRSGKYGKVYFYLLARREESKIAHFAKGIISNHIDAQEWSADITIVYWELTLFRREIVWFHWQFYRNRRWKK